jgi:hypothetical protein
MGIGVRARKGYDQLIKADDRAQSAALAVKVERGAAALDSIDPDWPLRLDPASLQMFHAEHCVLGQVFMKEAHSRLFRNGYSYGTSPEGLKLSPFLLGFDLAVSDITDSGREVAWSKLAELWIAAARERLDRSTETGGAASAPTL